VSDIIEREEEKKKENIATQSEPTSKLETMTEQKITFY